MECTLRGCEGFFQSQPTFSQLIECYITSNWGLLTPCLGPGCLHTEMQKHPDMKCNEIIFEHAGKHRVNAVRKKIPGLRRCPFCVFNFTHICTGKLYFFHIYIFYFYRRDHRLLKYWNMNIDSIWDILFYHFYKSTENWKKKTIKQTIKQFGMCHVRIQLFFFFFYKW